MAQPPGFEDANHPNLVCYFYKSLCFKLLELETIGLMFFFFFVAKMGLLKLIFWFIFVCEESEFCNCGSFFYCVDDIIITRSATDVVQQVIIDHTTEFDIKDLGLHHYFLGIQITRNEYGFPRQSMFMICYPRLRCLSPKPMKLLNCHTTYCLRMMANLMEN